MPKVTVADIVIRERFVEIPKLCPKCEADLSEDEALTMWEFQDQARLGGRLVRKGEKRMRHYDDYYPAWETPFDSTKGGETSIEGVGWICAECGEVLVEGKLDLVKAKRRRAR